MIVGTIISLAVVPTTLVGSVPTMTLGTKISLTVVPNTFLGAVVPTYVVGTTVHMTSLKISQFKYKKHLVWTLQEMREYPWAARLEFLELFLQLA